MTDQTQPRLQVGGQIDPRKHLYIRVVPLDNFMIYKYIIRLDRPD